MPRRVAALPSCLEAEWVHPSVARPGTLALVLAAIGLANHILLEATWDDVKCQLQKTAFNKSTIFFVAPDILATDCSFRGGSTRSPCALRCNIELKLVMVMML